MVPELFDLQERGKRRQEKKRNVDAKRRCEEAMRCEVMGRKRRGARGFDSVKKKRKAGESQVRGAARICNESAREWKE